MKIGQEIAKIFDLVVNMGVQQSDNLLLIERIRAVNFLSICWFFPLLTAALFCLTTSQWSFGLILFMTVTMLFLIPIFNSFRYHSFSILMFSLIINFNIILINVLFEFHSETYLYVFPFLIGIHIVFPYPDHKRELITHILFVVLSQLLVYIWIKSYPADIEFDTSIPLFQFLNLLFAFGLLLISLRHIQIQNGKQRISLEESTREIKQKTGRLKEIVKEKDVLLAEVHHRTKNNLALVSSMLNLQRHQVNDESFKEILQDCSNRIHSIASIHHRLYENGDFTHIDMGAHLLGLVHEIKRTVFPTEASIQLRVDVDSIFLSVQKAIPVALIVNELVTNSAKHAFPSGKGTIEVRVKMINQQIIFMVADDGIGYTKKSTTDSTTGMGMTIIESLADQLDATFEYSTDNGTSFVMKFQLD